MCCVLTAERTILLELKSLRVVLLILISLVISLLTFLTSECKLISSASLCHNRLLSFLGSLLNIFYTIKKDLEGFAFDIVTCLIKICQRVSCV